VTKEMIIEKIAEDAGISKTQAGKALHSIIDSITHSLKKNQKVTFVGFGTFAVSTRKAREGRNPKTGEVISIPAGKVPRFKAGKNLKDAVR